MDLKKYYEFFGNTSFGRGTEILFMQDGSFAICDKLNKKVTCYNADCVPFIESNNPEDVVPLSETNTVVVRDKEVGGYHIYRKGIEVGFILFERASKFGMYTNSNSSILVYNPEYVNESYIISTYNSEKGFEFNFVDSYINPHTFIEDGYGNVVIHNGSTHAPSKHFDKDGIMQINDNISKVIFLYGKRAILHFCDGHTELVSYGEKDDRLLDYKCILHSRKSFGVTKLGNYAVIYEKHLIASADDGRFLNEVNHNKDDEDEVVITPMNTRIAPYVIEHDEQKGFYPSSSYQLFDVEDKTLLVFFYNGKFYPVFIDLGINETEVGLLNENVPDEYADIIFQCFPAH